MTNHITGNGVVLNHKTIGLIMTPRPLSLSPGPILLPSPSFSPLDASLSFDSFLPPSCRQLLQPNVIMPIKASALLEHWPIS